MANGGSIKYNIGFNVDKSGLNELKSSLQEIKNMTAKDFMDINGGNDLTKAKNELEKIHQTLGKVDAAFESAFNSDLGTLNIAKFNQTLSSSGLTIQKIQADLARTGTAGQNAFRNMTSQILTTNMKLKESHTLIDSMATTMANTIKWGAASSVMNSFTGTVQRAYGYVKNLDGSLNDIRIVTGKSADEMDRFAEKANKAAKNLGQTTTNYTDAALIYYQQGLSDEEVQARAEVTLKAANVTGQSGAEVSEQLTAVWNGYKVSAEEAELYIDKLAAVAATTASDLEELSTGMSKVASAANLMGVDVDQLNAQLSTIVSVTRQAPESVGTALKTIYARMGDIEAGLDSETTLGDYTEKMAAMGVNVLNMNGKLRDMGEVMEEIGGKWTSMSREQQIYLSQVMAGTRQYNNLLSLFDNWDQYTKSLETSANAAGTLQEQQDVYMESTEAHLAQLKASWEDLYDSLLDADTINGVSDALSGIVSLMANFVDSIGGGSNVLLALGSIGGKVFSKHLANGIATFITNLQSAKDNATQLRAELAILNQYESANLQDDRTQVLVAMKRKILDLDKNITAEERNIANEYIKQQNELFKQQDALEARKAAAMETYNKVATDPGDINNPEDAKRMAKKLDQRATDIEGDINSTKIEGFDNALKKLNETRKEYNNLAQQGTDSSNELEQAEQKLEKAAEDYNKTIETQIKLAQEVAANDDFEEKNKKELIEALETLEKMRSKDGSLNLKNAQVVKQIQKVEEARVKTYKNQAESSRQAAKEMLGFADASRQGQESIDQLQGSYKSWISQLDLRNKIQQGIQLASSFGQVASAISSIGNIPDIWGNQDLSTGEKLLQTVTSLGFALPMLANSLGQVSNVLGITAAFTNAAATAKMSYKTAATAAALSESQLATAQTYANELMTIGISKETAYAYAINETALSKAGLTKITEIFTAVTNNEMLAEEADIAIKKVLAGENIKVGFSFTAAAEAAKKFFASLGPIGWAVIGLTAAFAAFKAWDHFTISAEEAGEKLKESIDSYKELENELKSLEGELSTTKDRIVELLTLADKGEITLTQKEELINLQAQNAELETQIALLQQKQELENRKIARDANEAYDKGTYNDNFGKTVFQNEEWISHKEGITKYEDVDTPQTYHDKGIIKQSLSTDKEYFEIQVGEIKLDDVSTFESWKESMLQLESEALENAKSADSGSEAEKEWEEVAAAIREDLEAKQTEYDERRESYLSHLESGYTVAKDALPALKAQNTYGQYDDTIKYYEQITYDYFKQIGTLNSLVEDTIIGGLKLDDSQKEELQTTTGLVQEDGSVNESKIKEIIGSDNFELLKTYSDTLGMSMGDVISTYQEMNGLLGLTEEEIKQTLEERQREKEQEIATETTEKYKDVDLGENQTLTSEDLRNSGFTREDLQNWEQISTYLDENTIRTKGWQEALKEAKSEYEEITALQKSNQELATAAEDYELDLEELKAYKELLLETNPELKENQEGIDAIVIANKRMEKGVRNIASNWEDFNEIMSDSNASIEDVSSIMPEINDALQDILNLDTEDFELLPPDFAQKHWDLINDVTNGVEGAVDELRDIAGQEILMSIDGVVDADGSLQAELLNIHNSIAAMDQEQFTVGVAIDPAQHAAFYAACNEIINAAGMTAEQAQAYFASMGYDAEITEVEAPPKETPWHIDNPILDKKASELAGVPVFTGTEVLTGTNVSPGGKALAVKVLTPTGSYGGGVGVKTTSPKSSTTPRSGGGGGGRKGGGGGGKGGGGGSKAKDPNKKDPITEERDLYHDINYELEQINNELTKQERLTEKLTGKNKIDALNKELEILEKQADAEHRKLLLLQNERDTLKETLKGDGVLFDGEGDISNYNAALDAKLAALNEMINRYNAMSAEEQEKFESELETAQEAYEKFKEDMERYDELMTSEIFEAQERIDDILDQQVEKNIEQLEVEIELNIDTKEAERQLREFVKDFVKQIEEDDFANNAIFSQQQLNSYLGTDGDLAVYEKAMRDAYEAYQKIQAGGTDDIYGDDAEKAKEAFENYRDEVYDIYGEMGDLIDEVYEAQLDGIDEVNDKLDEQLEKYEQLYDTVERNLETSKLLQGEEDYETQLKYYNQMKAVNIERQRLLQDEILMWERKIEAEIEAGRENSEAVKTMQEHLTEAQEELANTTAESLELIAESYEIAKQKLTKDMDLAATGGKGLNYLAQEWELLNDNADMYLDAVNSAYEISQLESKVLDAIDNTDSVYAQEKLNKLMDAELGKLREKEKITKYDIERANKLLDIELQKIALEEAQASKTQMRLRRDSQGNYTYQYVSDQDKVREAQEALEQAQNELYNMDKDAYKDNLDEIQSAYQDYIDEVNDLNILYADNEEEFYNQLILLNEKYNERIDGLTDQNKTIGFNLQGSTLDMVAKITGMDADALQMLSTKEIDKIMAQYIPQWSSGVAEMVAKLANGGFNELSEQLVEQLLKLEDSQKAEMDAAALQGNESLNNIANGADVVKDKINELGAETRDTFNEMDAMLKSLSESALKTEEIANNLKEAAEASAQIANNGNPLIYEKASGVDISDGKLDFSNSDSEIEGMNFKQYDNIQSTNSSANKEWYGNKNSILNGLENRIEKVPSDSLDAKKSILNGVEYSQFLIDKLNTSIEDKINQLEKYISNRQNKNPFVTEDLSKELNQSITINADFPDATNAKEIEDAFNNLINAASQYAYKVKK